ncbi:hypothetical protein TVAG_019410 [Trichomonas vaginalis G3]|uniref:Uncharacterized protein n=1 Tax=Trichomonas vaginalis (strain ATCC PRA-98 / G3) TaxID=412133 RepID=A2DX14_TRIV3|nr:protein ubiquitination [Trichomonas vaginalis G3]EAY15041.1 hypothetical protein TVAG_019410 [Trichomonas vaginalis G3]KAI5549582.1 protein ubiquitination [Trichomonas vaginalis G3]|eukprot:XP_001327264.1 hypothetical protein [Trichomonas vaginalis G3]
MFLDTGSILSFLTLDELCCTASRVKFTNDLVSKLISLTFDECNEYDKIKLLKSIRLSTKDKLHENVKLFENILNELNIPILTTLFNSIKTHLEQKEPKESKKEETKKEETKKEKTTVETERTLLPISEAAVKHYQVPREQSECIPLPALFSDSYDSDRSNSISELEQLFLKGVSQGGNTELLVEILENNPQFNLYCENNNKMNAMLIAIKNGNLKMVELLIDHGFDINRNNSEKICPLYAAIKEKNLEMFKFLVSKNAKLDILIKNQARLIDATVIHDAIDIFKYLNEELKMDFDIECARYSALYSYTEMLDFLWKRYPSIYNELIPVVIFLAASNGNTHGINYFIDKQKIPIEVSDRKGRTPLIYAIKHNEPDSVKLLLKKNANVNIRVYSKKDKIKDVFYYAAKSGNTDIFFALYTKNQNIGDYGRLIAAAKQANKSDMVEFLRSQQ